MGKRAHRLVVALEEPLVSQLENIAHKKGTSVEDLLKKQVIHEWIGKRHLVNQRIFEEHREGVWKAKNRDSHEESTNGNTADS